MHLFCTLNPLSRESGACDRLQAAGYVVTRLSADQGYPVLLLGNGICNLVDWRIARSVAIPLSIK